MAWWIPRPEKIETWIPFNECYSIHISFNRHCAVWIGLNFRMEDRCCSIVIRSGQSGGMFEFLMRTRTCVSLELFFFYLKHTWYLVFWVFRVSNWKTTISLEYHQKNVISFGAHQILKSLWHYHNKKYFRLFVFASFTFSINCLFFVVCFVFLFLYVSIRWHIRWNCSHFSNFLSLIPSIYLFFFDMEDPLNLAQFFYRIFGNLHGFLNETEVPAKSTILTAN